MAKNHTGRWLALATVAGAAAVGISYFKKYKSFNKELEEDFHDFEDDGEDDFSEDDSEQEAGARKYVSLHANRDEFKVAAGDMLDAAKDMAGAGNDEGYGCDSLRRRRNCGIRRQGYGPDGKGTDEGYGGESRREGRRRGGRGVGYGGGRGR